MKGTTTIRVYLSSYRKIRRIYPALKGESVAAYFERLSKWLDQVNSEWGNYP